jgi:uncharacterized protein HemY
VVGYTDNQPWPARVVEPEALRLLRDGRSALLAHRFTASDSLLDLASRAEPPGRGPMQATIVMARAYAAYYLDQYPRADSLARAAVDLASESPDYWALEARLAMARNDAGAAAHAIQRCLALDPTHTDGLRLARRIGVRS